MRKIAIAATALAAIIAVALLARLGGTTALGSAGDGARELWVTSQGTDALYVFRFPQMERLARIALPTGAQPHITTFHRGGRYAYVGGMGDGTVYVLDAEARQVVKTLKVAPGGAHQLRVTPDGRTALVAAVGNRTLTRLAVDESRGTWAVTGTLSLDDLQKAPVCTVFRQDGQRAYVSLFPNDIAVVDVTSMTLLDTLATDGFVACGMIRSADDSHVVIASNGDGGHIYTLDLARGTLVDRGTLGAVDWHSFNMTPDERLGIGTSPHSDEIVLIDLIANPVRKLGTLALTALPGLSANQPDALGGGEPIQRGMLPVSLRAAGQVAVVDLRNMSGRTYTPVVPPLGPFNPMTCMNCPVHGVTVRP
ncbi:MAG TPA: beta-propeller fold lactonase family protein [bacterium]|nr:beta-propeller fold lactonase family protein [bacterium]